MEIFGSFMKYEKRQSLVFSYISFRIKVNICPQNCIYFLSLLLNSQKLNLLQRFKNQSL